MANNIMEMVRYMVASWYGHKDVLAGAAHERAKELDKIEKARKELALLRSRSAIKRLTSRRGV